MIKNLITVLFIVFTLLLIPSVIQSQSNSNANTNVPNVAVKETQSVAENPKVKVIRDGLKTIADGSKELSGWCLLIIAASIAVVVKTSSLSPTDKRLRGMYLFFIPGWLFLVYSMYCGNWVARRYMAASLTSNLETLQDIGVSVNIDFSNQLEMFQSGLVFFIIWLLIYLFWWIYYYQPKEE